MRVVTALIAVLLFPSASALGASVSFTQGGCPCGAIRYRFTGAPIAYSACHCTDCQRQSGSAFHLSMIVLNERTHQRFIRSL